MVLAIVTQGHWSGPRAKGRRARTSCRSLTAHRWGIARTKTSQSQDTLASRRDACATLI